METIRFSSQKDWTVTDLQFFLHQLNVLYNRLYVLDELKPGSRVNLLNALNNSLSRVPVEKRLFVDCIEIHSPANIKLRGISKVVKVLTRIIILYMLYELGGLEIESKQIEIATNRAILVERMIDIGSKMKDLGYSKEQIHEILKKVNDPAERISSLMQNQEVTLQEEDENI